MSTIQYRTQPRARRALPVSNIALAIASVLVLAACTTGPIYRARGPGENIGYTDTRLTENRYRVTFTGGRATRREVVEDHLLRRAAELTLESGFTHFLFDARDTSARTEVRSAFGPRTRFGIGYGGSFAPRAWYWSSFHYDPFYDPMLYAATRFEAYSEIVMLTPQDAERDPTAIDADEVLRTMLGPPPPLPN